MLVIALFIFFVIHQTTSVYQRFFLCNSRKILISHVYLIAFFPSFDMTALAAWMNSNGGGEFSCNYEVDFPDDLHCYSVF